MRNRTTPTRRLTVRGRRLVAATAVLATGASLAVAVPAFAAPRTDRTPPPKPTTGAVTQAEVQQALGNKQAQAALLGRISGQVAAQQIEIDQVNAKLQYSEQLMALRTSQEQAAKTAAAQAKAAVAAASRKTESAHAAYARYITAVYSGADNNLDGTASSLLTASDPNTLLTQSTLLAYQARNKAATVSAMQTAQVVQSNAEAKAKTAQAKAVAATSAAVKQVAATRTLYIQAQAQQKQLELAKQQRQATYNAVTAVYNSKVSAKQAWDTYQAKEREYQAYLAEKARQAELARERAAAAARARAEAAAARARAGAHHNSGGGGGSSSSGGSSSGGGGGGSSAPAPSGGSWTPAKGRAAANRALSELGVMYAWAGGNAYGPTRGVCAGDGAWNDCNVIGFDCSGLAMYAWGKMWDHFAATQYWQAGSYHPPVSQLMPGDLLFWSYGSLSDIHHVAIYIGGGRMVEAPESNVPIRTASIYEYGSITGTTRPLT